MNTKLFLACLMFVAGAMAGGDHGYGDDEGELITPGVPFPDPITDGPDDRPKGRKTTEATVIEGDPNNDYYDPNEPCPGPDCHKKRKVQLNFRIKLRSKNKNRNINKIRIAGLDGGYGHSGSYERSTTAACSTTSRTTVTTTTTTTPRPPVPVVVDQASAPAGAPALPVSPQNDGLPPPPFMQANLRSAILAKSALSQANYASANLGSPAASNSVNLAQGSIVRNVPVAAKVLAAPVAKLKATGAARAKAPQVRAENKASGKMIRKLVDLRGKAAQM